MCRYNYNESTRELANNSIRTVNLTKLDRIAYYDEIKKNKSNKIHFFIGKSTGEC